MSHSQHRLVGDMHAAVAVEVCSVGRLTLLCLTTRRHGNVRHVPQRHSHASGPRKMCWWLEACTCMSSPAAHINWLSSGLQLWTACSLQLLHSNMSDMRFTVPLTAQDTLCTAQHALHTQHHCSASPANLLHCCAASCCAPDWRVQHQPAAVAQAAAV